ncbi:MAG: hypothetical protein IR158_18780 [Cellulomonas sp.]|uniref:hypothetical protein n=1 Tax=Cellulomonas sp. TaxID=40001 RepID=UPI001A074A76|nr:hypothetical protein [Cellulomonas sp.]MBF0689804.1 hypothetical protein [Cellulomonas sp.]
MDLTPPRSVAAGAGRSQRAVARIVRGRTTAVEHVLAHGDDGVAVGRVSDHEHGDAMSHRPGTRPHLNGDAPHTRGSASGHELP